MSPTVDYDWVLTGADWLKLRGHLERLGPEGVAVVDLETTGLDPYAATADDGYPTGVTLLAVSLAENWEDEPSNWVAPLDHPDSSNKGLRSKKMLMEFCQIVKMTGVPLVNHNLRFDLKWLYRFTSIDLVDQLVWDTRTAGHLLNENTSNALKSIVPELHDEVERWDDVDLSGGSHLAPLFDLGHYAARDTYWTWWLWQWQRDHLASSVEEAIDMRWDAVASIERDESRLALHHLLVAEPIERTLHVMERTGIGFDLEWARAKVEELEQETEDAYKRVEATDPELFATWPSPKTISLAPTAKFFLELADRAVERGDLEVTARTGTGRASWSKHVLVAQRREGSELAGALLDWRTAEKQEQFLRSWPGYVSPIDHRIHPSYRSVSTVTGRLSCADPNMQQIMKSLKPAWVPRQGYVLAEIDYSQIEMRVAAYVAPSPPMVDAYLAGDDLHTIMASHVSGVPLDEVTPSMRQGAKAINFGYLFGMMPPGFVKYAASVYDVAFTLDEATAFREAFFTQWDGLRDWHAKFSMRASRDGYVQSPLGRIRRVPLAMGGSDYAAGAAIRQAINSPIQSMASDLMQLAGGMVVGTVDTYTPYPSVRLVGSVHDSLVLEVEEKGWEEHVENVISIMVDEVPRYLSRAFDITLPLPLAAEAEVGSRWGLSDLGVIERTGVVAG